MYALSMLTCVLCSSTIDYYCSEFSFCYIDKLRLYYEWHGVVILQRVTETQNTVKLTDRMWARLLASTNQPSFLNSNEVIEVVNDMRITSI